MICRLLSGNRSRHSGWGANKVGLPLPFSPDAPAAFQFPASTGYGLRCGTKRRANLISLFNESGWQRWPPTAPPLENPLATWWQTSQPGVTLSPENFAKNFGATETVSKIVNEAY